MASKFDFHGPALRIAGRDDAVVDGVLSFTIYELYSDWKRWVQAGDNAKYPEALRAIGGDPIGGGQSVGFYLFLRNDLGWRFQPPAIDACRVQVEGSFFGESPTLCLMAPLPGVTTTLQIRNAALVTGVPTAGGGYTPEQVAAAVWAHGEATELQARLLLASKILRNRHDTDPDTGEDRIYDDDGVTVLLRGALWENVAGTVAYRGQGANRRDRLA